MKKILILFALSLIIYACEKEPKGLLLPSDEVPTWLKNRIAQDEKEIEANPRSELALAAWIRYEYKGEYFFVYDQPLSSAGPITYNYDGVHIKLFEDPYDYMTNRCCKQYVWKGHNYYKD